MHVETLSEEPPAEAYIIISPPKVSVVQGRRAAIGPNLGQTQTAQRIPGLRSPALCFGPVAPGPAVPVIRAIRILSVRVRPVPVETVRTASRVLVLGRVV
jgi:hypothetical protein